MSGSSSSYRELNKLRSDLWRNNEIWLRDALVEVDNSIRQLISELEKGKENLSRVQYCNSLAQYYLLLGQQCHELYKSNNLYLKSIKPFFEKVIEELQNCHIDEGVESVGEIEQFRQKAKSYLDVIGKKICDQRIDNHYQRSEKLSIQDYKGLICNGHVDKNIIAFEKFDPNLKLHLDKHIENIDTLLLFIEIGNDSIPEYASLPDITQKLFLELWDSKCNLQDMLLNSLQSNLTTQESKKKARELKAFIKKKVENGEGFEVVEDYVKKVNKVIKISAADDIYIRKKYIRYCLKLWLHEARECIDELAHSKQINLLQDLFYKLDSINGLRAISNPLDQLESYKLAMNHENLLATEEDKFFVSQFKKQFLEQVLLYSDSVKHEFIFLEELLNLLRGHMDAQYIIKKLELRKFCHSTGNIETLFKKILNLGEDSVDNECLSKLKEVTKVLKKETNLFLMDKLKDILSEYIKPIEFQEKFVDGRFILEVTGKIISVSKILQVLESRLMENPKIEEMRIIGASNLHIDKDLGNDVWHGRNIVVYASRISVRGKVTWDLSGKNASHSYSKDAGTGADGHGRQGDDGYAGESGGNVLILAEAIDRAANFTVVSNGGIGSSGQNGGNGKDGIDGKGVEKDEFETRFRSPVKCFYDRYDRSKLVNKLLEEIKSVAPNVEKDWKEDRSVFLRANSQNGINVTFSYCAAGFTSNYQGYVLYCGSNGQPGGCGGEYGLGGQGGSGGEIAVSNNEVVTKSDPGESGGNGIGGVYGKHGKNGWDMAYLDYQFWSNIEYFGFEKNKKLNLKFSNEGSSSNVWCPYYKKYVEISTTLIQNKVVKKYEERENERVNTDLQHQAQSKRKKTISQESILSNYSYHFSLENLEYEVISTESDILHAVIANQNQNLVENRELKIQYQSNYSSKIKSLNCNFSDDGHVYHGIVKQASKQDKNKVMDKLKNDFNHLDNWRQIRSIEVSHFEIEQLFYAYEILKKDQRDFQEDDLYNIESILLEKYKISTLQNISKKLENYKIGSSNNKSRINTKHAEKYLFVSKKNDNGIFHDALGSINQFIFKHNQNIILKFITDDLNETEREKMLCNSIKQFVLCEGKSKASPELVHKYYNDYENYLDKHEYSLNIFFEPLKDEIKRVDKTGVKWNEIFNDESMKEWFEKELRQNDFLRGLFKRFNNQRSKKFYWYNCYKDSKFKRIYENHIRGKGILSEGFRELLANIFNLNIRIYFEDENKKYVFLEEYNETSEDTLYLLVQEDKFFQLNIDEDYLMIDQENILKSNLYEGVLDKVEKFKNKKLLDDYVKNKNFLIDFQNQSKHENKLSEHCSDECQKISEIISFFPIKEHQNLKNRLEKISSTYVSSTNILTPIFRRFSNESNRVSVHELYHLVNLVHCSIIEGWEFKYFSWIIYAYPQDNWLDELLILQLKNKFKVTLIEETRCRKYLIKTESKGVVLLLSTKLNQNETNSIPIECIAEILHLLSKNSNEISNLEQLNLSEWSYVLKEKYWIYKLKQILTNWSEKDQINTASYYLSSVENLFGTNLVKKLLNSLRGKKVNPDELIDILINFDAEVWSLSEEVVKMLSDPKVSVGMWKSKLRKKFVSTDKDRNVSTLIKLIKDNENTSRHILDKLHIIKNSIEQIPSIKSSRLGAINGFTNEDIKEWVENVKDENETTSIEDEEILAVLDRAIELKRGFKLRDTQKLSVLALLRSECNTLAQVSTGEGKSLIVVATSIIKALRGEKIDVITSSSVLAKRDAEDNKDIYNLFNISVSHNSAEDVEKRKQAYSNNAVVYGDLSDFQRDYLLDRFYQKNILGDRTFENVIVDEVDSMLLDKGNNMLYLSHNIPDLDKLESVYVYIWNWINQPAASNKELDYIYDRSILKDLILHDLYGVIKVEDIRTIDSMLDENHAKEILENLIDAKILNNQGKLMIDIVNDVEISKILTFKFMIYKDRICFLLKETLDREKYINVPNYLKSFIEDHLDSWISSALTAMAMTELRDYIVDVDRTGTSLDCNPNITIIDRDTGTDQTNSQWDEALHQFLQLKHGCKLSLQTLKAVFISNVTYFKMYKNLYGLTGTLGSHRERDLLKNIHDISFVTIPTAKSKNFREILPIICTSTNEWVEKILSEANHMTEKNHRSVLIICETVEDVHTLHKMLKDKTASKVYTYTRDYEQFDVAEDGEELQSGKIIIATNLAGRGTDINISKELNECGGLHVCLTYLPNNKRIEQQAFGRAARKGDKGTGQLIIKNVNLLKYSNLKIFDVKKRRDNEELHRLAAIKSFYETQITTEEYCFKKFKDQYESISKILSFKSDETESAKNEIKNILLETCLNKWAFWLDKNASLINSIANNEEDRIKFNNVLDNFLSHFEELKSDCSNNNLAFWVEQDPVQMIKLGKYFSQNGEEDKALELFDQIIEKEPQFSASAHYYKAFAIGKKIDFEENPVNRPLLKKFKIQLHEAEKCFEEVRRATLLRTSIINKLKKHNRNSIIQIDGIEEQAKSLSNIYQLFSQSMQSILGSNIVPNIFVTYEIEDSQAKDVFEDLLNKGILRKPIVKKEIPSDILQKISLNYGISGDTLVNFISRFKGKEVEEDDLLNEIEKNIIIPGREHFWNLLIDANVFVDEVEYAIIERNRLESVDPSLLDLLLIKQKQLEINGFGYTSPNQIFLYAENIDDQRNELVLVFKVIELMYEVGSIKFQLLKKNNILTINKRANINFKAAKSFKFQHFDSITIEDFSKEGISFSEAEKILSMLVSQKILEKSNSETCSYHLAVSNSNFENIKLPSCPLYEGTIKILLSFCFAYNIALQKIMGQITNNNDSNESLKIQLMSKPHNRLFFELVEQNIIKRITMSTQVKKLENKLKKIYSQLSTKEEIQEMLLETNLIPTKFDMKILIDHLIEKKWISLSKTGNMRNLYYINPSKTRNANDLDATYNDIQKTVKLILNKRTLLTKKDTIKTIVSTMEQSKGLLKSLKVPNFTLKPLIDLCSKSKIIGMEEVQLFCLNGLDHIICLEEKKWTTEMLLNTAIVAALGICQIVIGVVIELYSVGIMTHVGAAFINEGVNDIFFSAGCLWSGYFSWEDYGRHKLESLAFTAVTVGVGAYLSRGAKVSRFGRKLASPGYKVGGKAVAEMSGKSLIKTASGRAVGKAVTKRVVAKTFKGLAFGLASSGIDVLVSNYLNNFCSGIAQTILQEIEENVEKHSISVSIKKSHDILGEDRARAMLNDLTSSYFNEKSFAEKFLSVANGIASSVIKGMGEATKKMKKVDGNFSFPVKILSETLVWLDRAAHIGVVRTSVNRFLDGMEVKINDELEFHNDRKFTETKLIDSSKLNKNVKSSEHTTSTAQAAPRVLISAARAEMKEIRTPDRPNDEITSDEDKHSESELARSYDNFKKEIIATWKTLLREKAQQVIEQHIVSPILKDGACKLLQYVGNQIKDEYRSLKEELELEYFENLKRNYEIKLKDVFTDDENNRQMKNHITKEYQENLIKLLGKTKNPKLFACLIQENIPMDLTCVDVCSRLVTKIFQERGLEPPGIVVEGENGVIQDFSFSQEGQKIRLILKNNHFQVEGGDASSLENHELQKNDCLFEAVTQKIQFDLTAKEFRSRMADVVLNDSEIRDHIRRGWHHLPMFHGAYGGLSGKSDYDSRCRRPGPVPLGKLNSVAEAEKSYQHSGWKFVPGKDLDFREEGQLTIERSNTQRVEAFNAALERINRTLSEIGSLERVTPASFEATMFDHVLVRGTHGETKVGHFPVEMQASVEVKLRNNQGRATYNVMIDLDNPVSSDVNGPHGPHVGYKVSRTDKSSPYGCTGHILVNEYKGIPDRHRGIKAGEAYGASIIPVARTFFQPTRPSSVVYRIDIEDYWDKSKLKQHTKGRSFFSPDL